MGIKGSKGQAKPPVQVLPRTGDHGREDGLCNESETSVENRKRGCVGKYFPKNEIRLVRKCRAVERRQVFTVYEYCTQFRRETSHHVRNTV